WAELLKRNSPYPITRPMFRAFFMISSSPCNAPRDGWPKQTRASNPSGFAVDILILKKSQTRGGGRPFRRRGQFQAGPDPLPNLGSRRSSARDSNHGPEEYAQNLRHHRIVQGAIPLPLRGSVQCRNLHCISGANSASVFPAKGFPYSRQRI